MTSYQKTLYKIFINIPQAMQIVVPVDNVKQCETRRDDKILCRVDCEIC